MATFARGFPLLSCRGPLFAQRVALPELFATPARFFTTSLRPHAAAKPVARAVKLPPKAPSPTISIASSTAAAAAAAGPSRYAFVKSLASKPTPTTLYEAPSHFWFYFGCWSSGLSIIAWTTLTGPSAVQQPEGVPQWVGMVFGASYMLLGLMGFFLISKTPNIVNTIRLLPPPHAVANAVTAGASNASPQLEVTVKRMLPLLQPKVITTNLDNVILQTRFSLPGEYVPELQRLERQREVEAQRKALHKFDMGHLLTMPFRRLGRAFANMFRGIRAAWTDMGYGIIKVDDKEYKVDVTKGFAHDGFRTLERIVKIGWK